MSKIWEIPLSADVLTWNKTLENIPLFGGDERSSFIPQPCWPGCCSGGGKKYQANCCQSPQTESAFHYTWRLKRNSSSLSEQSRELILLLCLTKEHRSRDTNPISSLLLAKYQETFTTTRFCWLQCVCVHWAGVLIKSCFASVNSGVLSFYVSFVHLLFCLPAQWNVSQGFVSLWKHRPTRWFFKFLTFSHMNFVFFHINWVFRPKKKVNWVEKRLKSCEKMSKICGIILSVDVFPRNQNLAKHSIVPCYCYCLCIHCSVVFVTYLISYLHNWFQMLLKMFFW